MIICLNGGYPPFKLLGDDVMEKLRNKINDLRIKYTRENKRTELYCLGVLLNMLNMSNLDNLISIQNLNFALKSKIEIYMGISTTCRISDLSILNTSIDGSAITVTGDDPILVMVQAYVDYIEREN